MPDAGQEHRGSFKHGAWSKPVIDAVANRLLEIALTSADVRWRERPSKRADAWGWTRWAKAEARVLVLTRWFAEQGVVDEDGNDRRGLAALRRSKWVASQALDWLGVDSRSRAFLDHEVLVREVDLADVYEQIERERTRA